MFTGGRICGTCADGAKCAVRSYFRRGILQGTGSAWVAQLVERVLGKDEVTGSIPVPGSRNGYLAEWQGRRVCSKPGGGNSTVESHSSKVMVAGSNPVPRSKDWAKDLGSR